MQLSGAFPLLWSLRVAANTPTIGQGVHQWIVGQLRDIGAKLGINMALMIARNVEMARVSRVSREMGRGSEDSMESSADMPVNQQRT